MPSKVSLFTGIEEIFMPQFFYCGVNGAISVPNSKYVGTEAQSSSASLQLAGLLEHHDNFTNDHFALVSHLP